MLLLLGLPYITVRRLSSKWELCAHEVQRATIESSPSNSIEYIKFNKTLSK